MKRNDKEQCGTKDQANQFNVVINVASVGVNKGNLSGSFSPDL